MILFPLTFSEQAQKDVSWIALINSNMRFIYKKQDFDLITVIKTHHYQIKQPSPGKTESIYNWYLRSLLVLLGQLYNW